MRFLLTDDVPTMADGIRAAGHTVCGDPGDTWISHRLPADADRPERYPLGNIINQHGPDVVILVSPLRMLTTPDGRPWIFGCMRGMVNGWTGGSQGRRHTCVWYSSDDPVTWDAFARKAPRACIARPNDAHVYVTPDAEARRQASGGRPAIVWRPGDDLGPMLRAIEWVRAGNRYSARKDDKWG